MLIDLHGFGITLAYGAWMTIRLALCAVALGLALGLAGALSKTSSFAPLRWLSELLSTLVRGIPELLWVLLIYFSTVNGLRTLGEWLGCGSLELDPFAAGVISLGLCFGAYATEVFRGALLSIPRGQREAGLALGLSRRRIFGRLILPQMWRVALPGLGNLFLVTMKDTALVSVIGLGELMRSAQTAVTNTKQAFTFYLAAACIYLALTSVAMLGLYFLEKRARRGLLR